MSEEQKTLVISSTDPDFIPANSKEIKNWQVNGETVDVEVQESTFRNEVTLETVEIDGKQAVVKLKRGFNIKDEPISRKIWEFQDIKLGGVIPVKMVEWRKVGSGGNGYVSGYDILPENNDDINAIKAMMDKQGYYLVKSNQYDNTDDVLHFNKKSRAVQVNVNRKRTADMLGSALA